ncbi:MAG: hypothetical protein V4671_29970 [Armatimonadota bacterium]
MRYCCSLVVITSLFLTLAGTQAGYGQSAETTPAPDTSVKQVAPRTVSKLMAATIVSVTPATNIIRLRETETGTEITALLDADSRLTRKNGPAALNGFTTGEKVMARMVMRASLSPRADATVRDIWDESSYAAERRIRTEISVGKVVANTASALEVQQAKGGALVHFRVSGKTKFLKEGREVTAAAFPVGASVAVKPRGLPTGGVMASMVGENADALNQTHRDGLIIWQGTIASVDPVARQITLSRDDGATRIIVLTDTTTIRKGRRDVKLGGLAAGDYVKAHLIKGVTPGGFRSADQISVPLTVPVKKNTESGRAATAPKGG